MNDKLEQVRQKLNDKSVAVYFMVGLGLLGMLLILCSSVFEKKANTEQTPVASIMQTQEDTPNTYCEQLEIKLTDFISQMEGAGKVTVMVTLFSGEEAVYAQDYQENQTDYEQNHVLLQDGSALTQTIRTPRVCGVAILCEGGDNMILVSKINAFVTALFDISSNHVQVGVLHQAP